MQYTAIPTSGTAAFRTKAMEVVSEAVKKSIMEKVTNTTLADKIEILIQNDITQVAQKVCREIYEDVVPELLIRGTNGWSQRSADHSVYKSLELQWKEGNSKIVHCAQPPKFDEMEDGVIYRPVKENHPAVDFMFRLEERLYGVDVTRQCNEKRKSISDWPFRK